MCFEALPSPYGLATCWLGIARKAKSSSAAVMILSFEVPTKRQKPADIPSGRSVRFRITSTRLPKEGASS